MHLKVLKIVFPLFAGLLFLFFVLGCGARIDFLGVIEDKSVPDINIKIGDSSDVPNGTGSYDFGTIQVDTSKSIVFIIENIGLLPLNLGTISINTSNGEGFTLSQPLTSHTIKPQCCESLIIEFSPSSEGPKSGMVTVESNDPDENPYTFTVEGYGTPIPVPDIIVEKQGVVIPDGSQGHDFGTVLIGDTSIPLQMTIQNEGTADLVIDSIAFVSGEVTDYTIDDAGTIYIIPPEGSTTFNFTFSPLSPGPRTATVAIENNDEDSDPFTFTITGVGEPKIPDIYVLSGSDEIFHGTIGYDFGNVMVGDVGSPHIFTIGNRGTDTLNISDISSTDSSQFVIDSSGTVFFLPPGDTETTTIMVTFEPVEPYGLKSAEIILLSDDPDTAELRFTVVGYASPIPVSDIEIWRGSVEVNAGTLGFDFGPVAIGDSCSPVSFTIRNGGDADLMVMGISSSSGDFTADDLPSLPCDIQPNGSESFTVSFSPSGMGLSSAAITVMNDDPDENVFTFYVQGETALPDMRVMKGATPISNGETDAHDFGTVLIGDASAPMQFTIQNNGDADLIINNISFVAGDSADFSYNDSATAYTISPGGSTSFSITFTPIVSGHRWVTVSIENNDLVKTPYTFTVEGEGELKIPDIHLREGSTSLPSGSPYNFGTVLIGASLQVQFTIRNYGTGDLTVYDITSSSSEFTLTSSPSIPFSVAPGTSRYITISFAPTLQGNRNATLTLMSDDPDSFENPYTLTMQGYGETPVSAINVRQGLTPLPNGSGIYFFGHVQEYDTKSETITIENNGTASLIISGILLTDGDTDQFSINYSIPPIAPGGSSSFTVTFSPTYPGDKWAEITIVNNDPDDDLYSFMVEGMVGLPPVVDIEVWEGATYYPDYSTYSGFGTVQVGMSSSPALFTIWNNGPDDLLIPSIVITGGDVEDFDLDLNSTDLNNYIPAGWSTTFRVTFAPQSAGDKWLEININYNDPNVTPYTLRFEGVGED